jgi:hypothetical protein
VIDEFVEWIFFCCCLVQMLHERPYVGIVPRETVAVYCCTVFVSVSLSAFFCMWACRVLLETFFCVCPIVCQSVCVLTLVSGTRAKKCLSLNIVARIRVAQIPAMSDILLLAFSHSYLQERTRVGFVLWWLCAHQAVLFTFTLIDCWICIDFLYPL